MLAAGGTSHDHSGISVLASGDIGLLKVAFGILLLQ